MLRVLVLTMGILFCGCAHRGAPPLDVEPRPTPSAFEEAATVEARDGGLVADLQFKKFGNPKGRIRISASMVDAQTIELGVDYEPGRQKCVSMLAYRVNVDGLAAGPYTVVVRRGNQTISRTEVVVPASATTEPRGRPVVRIASPGC